MTAVIAPSVREVSSCGVMSDYRRVRIPGGFYFFTVNLAKRTGNDLLIRHVGVLRQAVRDVRRDRPFRIDAFVVLPDHLHAIELSSRANAKRSRSRASS